MASQFNQPMQRLPAFLLIFDEKNFHAVGILSVWP
jgi:hypothetical protein